MKKRIGILLRVVGYVIVILTLLAALMYAVGAVVWLHAPVFAVIPVTGVMALLPLGMAWLCRRFGIYLQEGRRARTSARAGKWLLAGGAVVVACAVVACTAAWNADMPRADFAYNGNGDARILEFMRGNYMSSGTGIAERLQRHLAGGLQAGQVIDKPYLVQRGAICIDGTPVVCTFNGVADEHFGGIPKENAGRAHRVTRIEARILLLQTPRIEVIKEESYPD